MFSLNLKYTGFPPRKRDYNTAKKAVLTSIAQRWHNDYLPDHFTEEGARKYGYYARKGQGMDRNSKAFRRSYTGRKSKMFGHEKPLVFSGEARGLSRLMKVRATSRESRTILPTKFNFRHPKSRIRMRDEVTRVRAAERDSLIVAADNEMQRQLQKFERN